MEDDLGDDAEDLKELHASKVRKPAKGKARPACVKPTWRCNGVGRACEDAEDTLECNVCGERWQSSWWYAKCRCVPPSATECYRVPRVPLSATECHECHRVPLSASECH